MASHAFRAGLPAKPTEAANRLVIVWLGCVCPSLSIYLPTLLPFLGWYRKRQTEKKRKWRGEKSAGLEHWRMGGTEAGVPLGRGKQHLACCLRGQDLLGWAFHRSANCLVEVWESISLMRLWFLDGYVEPHLLDQAGEPRSQDLFVLANSRPPRHTWMDGGPLASERVSPFALLCS